MWFKVTTSLIHNHPKCEGWQRLGYGERIYGSKGFFYKSDMTLNFDQIFFLILLHPRPCKLSEQVLINTDQAKLVWLCNLI